ncbi:hypothetical protein JYU34_010932 [Plutella xylostella]|uniref:Regulatory protein zeste n=1 Tax=Plutella xylostella TaxID=51655 RepID=A0ABQ7QFL9_PLUXY|nr:hypothetical protein JYU34_010932 [Plutella xylostella]
MAPPSLEQLETLLGFLEENKELALGRCNRTKEGRSLAKRLWSQCANILNSVSADCPRREPDAWRLYYNEYKSKVLQKIKKQKQELSATGGGEYNIKDLTPLQERLYAILGKDVGEPLPGVRHNPLNNSSLEAVQNEVSVEYMEEVYPEDPLAGPSWAEPTALPPHVAAINQEVLAEVHASELDIAEPPAPPTPQPAPPTPQPARPMPQPDSAGPPRRRRRRLNEGRHDQEQTLLEQAQQRHSEIDAQNARATVRLAESHERRAEATFKLAESQVKMAESLGKDAEGKMQIAQAITRLCAIVENYGAKFFQTSVSSPVKTLKRKHRTPPSPPPDTDSD